MRDLHYTILDVFADRALEGNPLAVFHDGRGLSTERMQAIAREMNLSETAFILPSDFPADDVSGIRVRIFTTQEELPFAGHPTLGTASYLHLFQKSTLHQQEITLRLGVGPIAVRFETSLEGGETGVVGTMRQPDPEFGASFDPAEVAGVLGLDPGLLMAGHPPQGVSTGNAFCIVALRSVEALETLCIPQLDATKWLRNNSLRWFYVIAPVAGEDRVWRARMQFYSGEDPATGSAAGPCIAWLVRRGLAPSGEPVELRQGIEMRRPSRLMVAATLDASHGETAVRDVYVGGRTIPVATGRLFLPDEW